MSISTYSSDPNRDKRRQARTLRQCANLYIESQDIQAALPLVQLSLEEPIDPEAYWLLALISLASSSDTEAKRHLDSCLSHAEMTVEQCLYFAKRLMVQYESHNIVEFFFSLASERFAETPHYY